MRVLLKTNILLVIAFCAASVFAQDSENWIAGDKADGIETFYRFEKSGTDTYEVEVKIINRRAKAVDVIIKFEQKADEKLLKKTRKSVGDLIRIAGKHTTLTVKAKGTSVSEKVEVEGLEIIGVKIACWSNIDSKKKCDLDKFQTYPGIRITPP